MSLLIKNGKVYRNGALARKNIFIKNHKIEKITSQDLKAEKIIDRKKAIEKALQSAEKGDTVLIAGRGHEKHQDFNGKKVEIDDKIEVGRILNAHN